MAECSDGSIVYRFGNISEIRENTVELDQEKLPQKALEEGGIVSATALLTEDVELLNLEGDSDEAHNTRNINTEYGHSLTGEIESSPVRELRHNSALLIEVADPDQQLPANESDVDVSQNNIKHLKFDLVEDGGRDYHGKDVVSKVDNVPSVPEENSEVNNHIGVVVPTVTAESDMSPDYNIGASEEAEEQTEGDSTTRLVTFKPESAV